MYVSSLAATVRRQWLLVLLGLGLAVAAAVLTFAASPPEYQATRTVLLLGPTTVDPRTGTLQNPYLTLDSSVPVAAQVVSTAMMQDQRVVDALARAGVATEYVVAPVGGSGPFIDLSVKSGSEKDAQRGVAVLFEQLQTQLVQAQQSAGAPKGTYVRTVDVASARVEVIRKRQLQKAGEAGVAVVVLALGLAFLLDARRSLRPASGRGGRPGDERDESRGPRHQVRDGDLLEAGQR
jgi:uncharacterized protein involved in exopolysaccharide biosynthesis